MTDQDIVQLYWDRSECAIDETDKRYGKYCHRIAYNILYDDEDSKECVNDTYLKCWESIPPQRPNPFIAFLGKITRNLSLNRYQHNHAQKRGNGELPLVLDELETCIGTPSAEAQIIDKLTLASVLDRFLSDLSVENRRIFLQRYWYICSIPEIAKSCGATQSKVKMALLRSRNKLRTMLEEEGFVL